MTYGEVFQDKTIIENYLISNVSFLNEFKDYLTERVKLEKEYAKQSSSLIQKYTQKFNKKRGQSICYTPTTPNPMTAAAENLGTVSEGSDTILSPTSGSNDYTYMNAWRSILNQMEAVNRSRIAFSDKVIENVIEKLKQQINIKDDERKKYLKYHKNIIDEVEKVTSDKVNARKKLLDSNESMTNHQKKLNKQDSTLNDDKPSEKGKKKLDKLNDILENAQVDINNKKNLYILSLKSLNCVKRKVYNEYIPEIYNNLQATQESMVRDFQLFSKEYITLEQKLSDDIKSSFSITINDIDAIDPVNDNNIFENDNKKPYIQLEDEKYIGAGSDVNGEFVITDKSSIFLSNTSASLQNDLSRLQLEFNDIKNDYDMFQSTYGNYINDPTKMDAEDMRDRKCELLYKLHMAEIPIIINQSKIDSIANAIGDDVKYNKHNFKSILLINSTHCDLCQKKLRGKALQCKDCSFTCHPSCEENVPERCSGIKMDRKVLRIGTMADSKDGSIASPIYNRSPSIASSDYVPNNDSMVSSPITTNQSPLINNNSSDDEDDVEDSNDALNEKIEIKESSNTKPTTSSRMCAIFEYQPQNSDEVSLSVNETVDIIEPEADGWVKVKTSNGEGFVPSSYIAPIKTAIYSFEPEKDDEIAINEGDSVVVLGQGDAGWLKIKKGSLEGIVPESYIDM